MFSYSISIILLSLFSIIKAGPSTKFHRPHIKRNSRMNVEQFNWGSKPEFEKTCSSNVEFNPKEFVELHNKARKSCNAEEIEWDQSLANFAQCWANRCQFEHSHMSKLGENIACGSGPYKDSMAIQEWWDEYKFWKPGMDYTDGTGHYTQMAWKGTQKVGCGVANCPSSQLGLGGTFPVARFVVCDYWPPGNIINYFQGEVDLPRYDCFSEDGSSDYDQPESSDYSNPNDNSDYQQPEETNQNQDQDDNQSDYNSSPTPSDTSSDNSESQMTSYSYNFTSSSPSVSTIGETPTGGKATTSGTTTTTTVQAQSQTQFDDTPKPQTVNNDANQTISTTNHTKNKHKKVMKKKKCKAKTKTRKHHKKKKRPVKI